MGGYVAVLNYAIPFFVGLLLLEVAIARWKDKKVVRSMDTLSSLSSGLTNVIKDVLGLTVIIVSYEWLEEYFGILDIPANWLAYLLAFIGIDFAGYWIHRISHSVNYFWNHHIIHHSSEEFNLGCALRQSISNWFSITFIFLVPTAIIGVPTEVIAIVKPLHLFAQYWYHTRLIGKMGFLEHIIVTPSHHRVHHAINKEYLDKNLSQIFIFWDKFFGTFQKELDEVPPVYGVKRPVRTWNPIIINFIHLWQLIKDAWYTRSIATKLKIWFMPTGWRPADVKEKYPIEVISDEYQYQKYDPPRSQSLELWSWFQFVITFVMMMYMFNRLGVIGFSQALLFGAFLFLTILIYTLVMDRKDIAIYFEALRFIIGLSIIYFQGDWFTLNTIIPSGHLLVVGYISISLFVTYYFSKVEIKGGEKFGVSAYSVEN